jgi:CspA family cold shock protein
VALSAVLPVLFRAKPLAITREDTNADVVGVDDTNKRSGKKMAEGTIKRLTDKGFGFIETGDGGKDMFFHMSACEDCQFDELREGQRVSFNVGQGPKGPRAENVRVV